MFRILFFLFTIFALALGFALLADKPGTMVMTVDGYQYQVSLMVAAVIAVSAIAGVMILWWLIKSIWNSPAIMSRHFRARRRDRGYQSLSTGLIAAGAGDAEAARRLHRQTAKLLSADQEPLIHLLEAQASLLEGDHASARKKFEALIEDPETRLIGLRGLYLEAERLGDRGVARHYAERANAEAPQLAWAANAALEVRMSDGDWDGALRILDAQKASRQVAREDVARNRAVLLTAKSISLSGSDPLAAKNAALEANRLDPHLVPAAIAAAKALFRQDDLRKGAKILEAAWKHAAHPEIADAYVHARAGDSAVDRLKRAQKLNDLRANNVESSLAVARAALEAGEYKLARNEAEAAIRLDPREAAFLLMADIEEADGGDQGKVRQYLARAVKAPRDPAWTADGVVSDRWAPFSPVTGRIGAFEWRAPVEQVGQLIEQTPQDVRGPVDEPVVLSASVEERDAAPKVIDINPVPANDSFPKDGAAERPASPESPVIPEGPVIEDANPPRPDDPGVTAEEKQASDRRFKLF
ncbi:MAG: heme biosynthesis protein HemY [Mesorhizobium sp.]